MPPESVMDRRIRALRPSLSTSSRPVDEHRISRPGEQWRIFYVFAFNGERAEYVVRKVSNAAQAARNGITPSGPSVALHPIEHCLNQHLGGPSPYSSASHLARGVPNITGQPVWIDVSKIKPGDLISYEDILRMSRDFLRRNPHLRERFDIWARAGEKEALIRNRIPREAISTENGMRIRGVVRVGGKALFLYAVYADTRDFFEAEYKSAEAARIAGGWTGAWAGGCAGTGIGVALTAAAGQAGPQILIPEEVVTVPAGGIAGGFVGGWFGYWAGSEAGRNYYDFIQDYLKRLR